MFYTIKNGNSAEDTLSALRTDNFATADLHNFPILMSLTVNFPSLLAKKESFINLLDTYNPDIVFGKESWLKPDVLLSEAFPEGHSVYGTDRSDGYGGVLFLVEKLLFHAIWKLRATIVNWLQLQNNSSLIVCSAYHPPVYVLVLIIS